MTTPRTAPVTLSEQDKASLEAAKQLPWTPPLLPLSIRRPILICDTTPGPSVSKQEQEDPVTPRNQGITLRIPGAPRCPPLLQQPQQEKNTEQSEQWVPKHSEQGTNNFSRPQPNPRFPLFLPITTTICYFAIVSSLSLFPCLCWFDSFLFSLSPLFLRERDGFLIVLIRPLSLPIQTNATSERMIPSFLYSSTRPSSIRRRPTASLASQSWY